MKCFKAIKLFENERKKRNENYLMLKELQISWKLWQLKGLFVLNVDQSADMKVWEQGFVAVVLVHGATALREHRAWHLHGAIRQYSKKVSAGVARHGALALARDRIFTALQCPVWGPSGNLKFRAVIDNFIIKNLVSSLSFGRKSFKFKIENEKIINFLESFCHEALKTFLLVELSFMLRNFLTFFEAFKP